MEQLKKTSIASLWIWSLVILGALVGGYFVLDTLTRRPDPQPFSLTVLELYQENPHLDPFSYQAPAPDSRLFNVSREEARKALSKCAQQRWKAVGFTPKQYSDDFVYYLWECDGTIVIRASQLWEPNMGHDGYQFGACKKDTCPTFPEMFENLPRPKSNSAISEQKQ